MTRRGGAAPPPVRRRTGPRPRARVAGVVLALTAAALLAACGPSTSATPIPTAAPGASTRPGSSARPGASAPAVASAAPDASGRGEPSTAPVASDEPPVETPVPSESPGASAEAGADACTGSAENRDFFAAGAEAFTWDVYCAVLPDGWFVDTGSFRLADGGRLEVSYKGPGGQRIEISEGAWCTTGASACSPRDHEIGPARFGDREGTLVTLGPAVADGFAVYVDPGAAPSWAISGKGMDVDAFEAIAAALHRVSR
jgi:hypothetical protein